MGALALPVNAVQAHTVAAIHSFLAHSCCVVLCPPHTIFFFSHSVFEGVFLSLSCALSPLVCVSVRGVIAASLRAISCMCFPDG